MVSSCSCGDFDDFDEADWMYYRPNDFTKLKTEKRKRCKSCNKLIDLESLSLKFERFRYPKSEIELKIYQEDYEIKIAPWHLCEGCGEQYYNLLDQGFCVTLGKNMFDLLEEYQQSHNF